MSGVRIAVADCSPVFLRDLTSILRSEHTFELVASCCDGIKSLQAIRDLSTDVALIKSSMPLLSGVKVLAREISERSPTRIVLLMTATALPSIFVIFIGGVPRMYDEVMVRCLQEVAAGQSLRYTHSARRNSQRGAQTHH